MGSGTSSKKGQKGADEVQNDKQKSENASAPELEANPSAAPDSQSRVRGALVCLSVDSRGTVRLTKHLDYVTKFSRIRARFC